MFFIAVYEANIYTLSFDTSDFTDDVQNQDYNVVLSNNNTLSIEYNTNVVEGTIPTASLKDNNMLRFTGWQNKDYGIYLEYDEGLGTFSTTASWKNAPSGNTIVLEPVFEPKTVTLHYCNENGNTTGQTTLWALSGHLPREDCIWTADLTWSSGVISPTEPVFPLPLPWKSSPA